MEKLKQNWPLIMIIILLFSVLIVFLIGYTNIDPNNMYVYDMNFNGEVANVELAGNDHLSKVIFILMLAVIFSGLIVLFILVININTKANIMNTQTIIDTHRRINEEGISLHIEQEKSFIVAYKDFNDEKITLKEKRHLADLITNNYDIYISFIKTRATNDSILYDVYIEGKLLLTQVSYKEIDKNHALLPIFGDNKEEDVE